MSLKKRDNKYFSVRSGKLWLWAEKNSIRICISEVVLPLRECPPYGYVHRTSVFFLGRKKLAKVLEQMK